MVPDAIRQLIAEQKDMEVVGDCRGPMQILQETGRSKADTVILAQRGADEPGLCSQLLAVYPDLTVVIVALDIRTTFTQQLCSHRKSVTSGEFRDIVQVIRVAVQNPCSDKQTAE